MDLHTYIQLQTLLQSNGLYEASELMRKTYPKLDKKADEFFHQCEKDQAEEDRKMEQMIMEVKRGT